MHREDKSNREAKSNDNQDTAIGGDGGKAKQTAFLLVVAERPEAVEENRGSVALGGWRMVTDWQRP